MLPKPRNFEEGDYDKGRPGGIERSKRLRERCLPGLGQVEGSRIKNSEHKKGIPVRQTSERARLFHGDPP